MQGLFDFLDDRVRLFHGIGTGPRGTVAIAVGKGADTQWWWAHLSDRATTGRSDSAPVQFDVALVVDPVAGAEMMRGRAPSQHCSISGNRRLLQHFVDCFVRGRAPLNVQLSSLPVGLLMPEGDEESVPSN